MNERIRVLLKQAGDIQYDEDGDELTPILVGKDLEKFAELIVRECARISNEADCTMTNQGAASAQAFMEHFGVEE